MRLVILLDLYEVMQREHSKGHTLSRLADLVSKIQIRLLYVDTF